MRRRLFLLLPALLGAGCADYREVPLYGATDLGPPVVLENADGRNAYGGVARLHGGNTCTGVLLDTHGGEGAPAYVLTNGHCLGAFGANELILDREAPAWTATFGYFEDTTGAQETVPVVRVAYATMKGADIGIAELDSTLGALERSGYLPWAAADVPASPSEPVVVVGAPLQSGGVGDFLRLATCSISGVAPIVLERQWYWYEPARLGCKGIAPGSSGSPVISRVSGRMVGVLNTTTQNSEGLADCGLNRPCEAEGHGGTSQPDMSYAVPLTGLGLCFDDDGQLDLERPACPLDDGRQAAPQPGWLGAVNPDLANPALGKPQPTWDVQVTGPFDVYRYKIGPAGSVDCRSESGYSGTRPSATKVGDALPAEEGRYALCLLGGDPGDPARQDVLHPSVATVEIDKTPPDHAAAYTLEHRKDSYFLTWQFDADVVGAFFKYGAPDTTSCADSNGYRGAFIPFFPFEGTPPFRLCVIGFDAALNMSAPADTLLP